MTALHEALEWQTARELAYLDASDHVRARGGERTTLRLDEEVLERVRDYAGRSEGEISGRIAELEREWDLARALEAGVAVVSLLGAALGARDRRFLLLSGAASGALVQHALGGWSPVVPLLRRAGLRTRREIDVEKYALKHLRGDFATTTVAEDDSAE